MKVECSYCGQYFEDSEAQCPSCGAPNEHIHRTADAVPRTIAQLKAYCEQNGFTPERTRFFVGEDYRAPRAFGIYQDASGEFVVYKNKADGSRAVRYRGKDEAYAVNQLYERLQSEILNQKARYVERRKNEAVRQVRQQQQRQRQGGGGPSVLMILALILLCFFLFTYLTGGKAQNGYYHYGNTHYYSLDDNWYYYNDSDLNWHPISGSGLPSGFREDTDAYYDSSYYDAGYGVSDFTDSDYYSDWEDARHGSQSSYGSTYEEREQDSTDWDFGDDDWDWDSSDWDFGDTDWDSDW